MSNDKLVIRQEDIDNNNVAFDGVKLSTKLTTGFDSDVDKDDKVTVDLDFILDGDSPELLSYIFDRLVAALRIKVNSPGDVLKGNAVDHETFVEFLEDNDKHFEFDVNELMQFKTASQLSKATNATKNMTPEELEQFKKWVNSQ